MITVAIIGPLTPRGSGNHAVEYLQNVSEGIEMACELIKLGFAPFCPHLDFQYVLWMRDINEEQLKDVSLEWVKRCDAVITLKGWGLSGGALNEHAVATGNGIPVFFTIADLVKWRDAR